MLTTCKLNDYNEELSGNSTYFFDGTGYISKFIPVKPDSGITVDIPPNIIYYDYNDDFIIALQEDLNNGNYKKIFYDKITRDKLYINLYFWIIDNRTNQIFGPLNISDYYQKRFELNIPESLKLEL